MKRFRLKGIAIQRDNFIKLIIHIFSLIFLIIFIQNSIFDHRIAFNQAKVIDKGNFRERKTLKSWNTAATENADNNSKPLPKQYTILLNK